MRDIIKFVKHVFQKKSFKFSRSFHQIDKRLCTQDYFKRRLAIEKRRSERSDYNSSIIIFSFKKHLSNNGFENVNTQHLLHVIYSSIRETDEVCLYKNHKLIILLPDTNNKGSQHVYQKILEQLTKNYLPLGELSLQDFDIEILSYPAKETEEKLPKDVKLNKTKASYKDVKEDSASFSILNQDNLTNNYFQSLNLCISSSDGSSTSLPIVDTFFLDQKLLTNFLLLTQKIIKKGIDIVGSIIGLIFLSPLMLLIALLIKISSPGPILFKQQRVGYRGKHFILLKFRTMYNNCGTHLHHDYVKKFINGKNREINKGSSSNPVYKMKDDERITPIGRFLRKTSLDELPQFLNVLTGDMSLVGPRPPIPYEVSEYKNWHYRRLLDIKPGLTGLWQVSGRNKTTFDEMVRLDIQYANNWSLLMDFKILLKTFNALMSTEGI